MKLVGIRLWIRYLDSGSKALRAELGKDFKKRLPFKSWGLNTCRVLVFGAPKTKHMKRKGLAEHVKPGLFTTASATS